MRFESHNIDALTKVDLTRHKDQMQWRSF